MDGYDEIRFSGKKKPRDEADCEELSIVIAGYEERGVNFSLQSCGHCEAILTLSGHPSRYVSDVDPFYNGAFVAEALPLAEDPDQPNAIRTATALNNYLKWVYGRLRYIQLISKDKDLIYLYKLFVD